MQPFTNLPDYRRFVYDAENCVPKPEASLLEHWIRLP